MIIKLKNIGTIITGNTPSKKNAKYYDSNDIYFIKPDTLDDSKITVLNSSNEFISNNARDKARIVGKNAILITCIGSIGKVGIVTEGEYAFNQQINAVIPNELVIPQYLAYCLLFNKDKLIDIANAPVVPIINKTQFGEFEININEDLSVQQKIVNELNTIQKIILKQRQELEKMDDLIKARFVEMFGGIHDSVLYPYIQTKKLCDVISGGTPNREKNEYWEKGDIPWIRTADLQNEVIQKPAEYITRKGLDNSSAKLVPPSTILIAMYGQGKTRGMTGYLNIKASTNQACACILPGSKINPIFMWKYYELSYEKLRNMAKGGNQPNLNGNMIKEFLVLLPPIELQNKFVDFVQQVDKSKLAVQQSLEKTQQLFDSLMQKYFG